MDPSRTLVVYYSRTGTTRTVARAIRDELGCAIERIADRARRRGFLGYLRSCFDALLRRRTALHATSTDPGDYDLVIVGTPTWSASIAPPVRAYLAENRSRIRRVAFFCTHAGFGAAHALRQMETLCGQPPLLALAVRREDLRRDGFTPKLRAAVSAMTPAPTFA
jgi:flavodoxin